MDNHPVPQNISSYEFHLVGDMTLKQFLQLAAGILVAFILIQLQILAFIKYGLAGISVLLGVLMAFVPINSRPFSVWWSAFIKAIYSPSQYVWVPEEIVNPPALAVSSPDISVSPPASQPTVSPSTPSSPVSAPPPPPPPTPTSSFSGFTAAQTAASSAPQTYSKETLVTKGVVLPPPPPPPTLVNRPLTPGRPVSVGPSAVSSPPIFIPPAPPRPIAPTVAPSAPPAPKPAPVTAAPTAATTSLISPPSQPNILAGLVLDPQDQPLPQITIEVVDTATGIPARALRTNKLGQFQIAIPLPAGNYNVIADKDGLHFDPFSIQVKGAIVPPVIIRAKTI